MREFMGGIFKFCPQGALVPIVSKSQKTGIPPVLRVCPTCAVPVIVTDPVGPASKAGRQRMQ